jgi:HPt (histidine-containing phosphotransfer) domain-containing protein
MTGSDEMNSGTGSINGKFDLSEFSDRMMGDADLIREVIQAMLEDTPLQMEALKKSFVEGDLAAVGRFGHKIKGGAANLCCKEFETLSLYIERAGKEGRGNDLEQLIPDLEKSWLELQVILNNVWKNLP